MSNRRRRKRKRQVVALDDGGNGAATIALAQPLALAAGGMELDREAGTLKNVSILAEGEAIGHGFVIDDVMLQQVAAAMNRRGGVKSRMTHPGGIFGGTDGIEMMVGIAGVGAVRVDGDRLRGDIQLKSYAKSNPAGDLWTYLFDLAEDDPAEIGLSVVFLRDEFEPREEDGERLLPAGRIKDVLAVDFVGDPASNPTGLLTANQDKNREPGPDGAGRPRPRVSGDGTMNEQLKKYLMSIGLKAGATDQEAVAYWNTRVADEKSIADSLASKEPDKTQMGKGKEPVEPATDPVKLAKKDDDPVALTAADVKKMAGEEIDKHRTEETERIRTLRGIGEQVGLGAEWALEQFEKGVSVEDAQSLALKHATEKWQPPAAGVNTRASVGVNLATEGLGDGISDAILLRAGVQLITVEQSTNLAERTEQGKLSVRKPHERSERFRRLSLVDMGRAWLECLGVSEARDMGRLEIAHLMTSRAAVGRVVSLAQSSSDFPLILADAMGKSLRMAYEEAPSTWQAWARRTTAPDFKDIKRLALSESPNLVSRLEGGEIKYVTLGESREVYALIEYISGIKLTRRAIVNDDMDAFRRIPALQGSAGRRKEDDVVYAIVTANAALSDGGALFNTTAVTTTGGHANLAGSGGAPTITTLNAGDTAIGLQKGIKLAAQLNLIPRVIMAPRALKGTVLQLLKSTADPTASGNAGVANIWENGLTPVFEARLDANSSTAWYLAVDPGQNDTVEIAFLEGEETPVLKSETEFDTDDVKMAVRHTVAAKAIDFRGLYKNTGA